MGVSRFYLARALPESDSHVADPKKPLDFVELWGIEPQASRVRFVRRPSLTIILTLPSTTNHT